MSDAYGVKLVLVALCLVACGKRPTEDAPAFASYGAYQAAALNLVDEETALARLEKTDCDKLDKDQAELHASSDFQTVAAYEAVHADDRKRFADENAQILARFHHTIDAINDACATKRKQVDNDERDARDKARAVHIH